MVSLRQVPKPFPVSMGWRWVRHTDTHRHIDTHTHTVMDRQREALSALPLLSRGFTALMVRNTLSLISELGNLGAA